MQPSHNAETFAPNPSYPPGVQERAYQTSKEAQARVIQQAQNYDPRYTVNTNPDAVNGPPIVTPDGTVLGGNSRTMSTQRLYSRGQGNAYRNYLSENAQQFGISPEAVGKMRNPVLVREIAAPADVEAARRLGSELNKNMTESITPQSLSAISTMLDDLGPESSIRDLLRERGREVMTLLTRDGAITERERPQFIDTATGGLSEEGKQFAERALLGTVVDDPTLMELAPKSRRTSAVESSAAYRWAQEWLAKRKENASLVSDAKRQQRVDDAARFFSGQTEDWWVAALRSAFIGAWERHVPGVPCPLPPIPSPGGERGREQSVAITE